MAAILYIKTVFPQEKFKGLVPAIILKHQIYCVVKDKTLVDRQLVINIASYCILSYPMLLLMKFKNLT